jgi:hypothetical protein
MADLLTHYVSSRIAGAGVRDRATLVLFSLGVLLPDLLGKPIGELRWSPPLLATPSHTVFGLIFACGAVSLFFAAPIRFRAFWALYLGSMLHLLLDWMKDYLGRGAVVWLHPFSTRSWEAGLYRSEDVFYLLPANLGILILLWVLGRKRKLS